MPPLPAKKKILAIALFLVTIGVLGYFWLNSTKIYYIDVPPGLDTMAFKASITLDPTRRIHTIKLPSGGTETDIFIYDSTYLETTQRNPLVQGSFLNDQEVLLNITALPRGKYYIHYMSCNIGGIFPLTIN